MKHTIRGLHGHLYESSGGKGLGLKKVCIRRNQIADVDYESGKLTLRFQISRKWKVCAWCWAPSEFVGGYDGADPNKVLLYECRKRCQAAPAIDRVPERPETRGSLCGMDA